MAVTLASLTPRQRDVLELIAKGLTNDEIGHVLSISIATVKTHITALLAALEVENRTEAAALYHELSAPIETVLSRPAIAVLPLVALDDAPRAATWARGFSYDLSSAFARACAFPVIAQGSSESARALVGGPPIAKVLGARFIVDGTLRTGADRWRVAIQIEDAESGLCLWSERYEFASETLFDVQDEVCTRIVAAAYPIMIRQAPRLISTRHDLSAWEHAHQGMAFVPQREPLALRSAVACFDRALGRDPTLVLAHFGLGLAAYDELLNQWTHEDDARGRLLDAALRCIAIAPHMGEGYFLQGRYHQSRGEHQAAAAVLQTAVANNPSFAQAHALLAQALQLTGHSDAALASMKRALVLGPRAFVAGLATLHFIRGEYREALAHAEAAIVSAPRYTFARILATASAHWAGDHARAAEHRRRLLNDYQPFSLARLFGAFGHEVDALKRIAAAVEARPTLG